MANQRIKTRIPPRTLWAIQTAVALLVMWIALDGLANVWLGVIFAGLGTAAGAWLVPGDPYPWRPLRMLQFLGYFLRASFIAGLDVARRALHPRMPISPTFSELELSLPPGLPRTMFIAVISLMPGTLSVNLLGDKLEVHALTPRAAESLPDLQRRIGRLFHLERKEAAP
jgi:multicomponent Na+:H+ antiporter subunit E